MVFGQPLGLFPLGVANSTCLANFFWDILDTWPNQRSWDLSIWKRMAQYSGFYEFHSCNLCRDMSHHEFFVQLCRVHLA